MVQGPPNKNESKKPQKPIALGGPSLLLVHGPRGSYYSCVKRLQSRLYCCCFSGGTSNCRRNTNLFHFNPQTTGPRDYQIIYLFIYLFIYVFIYSFIYGLKKKEKKTILSWRKEYVGVGRSAFHFFFFFFFFFFFLYNGGHVYQCSINCWHVG